MSNRTLNLNASQLAAVTTNAKYARVIAGAGSGKTKVLTERIAYLVNEAGILGYRILAITFTNKAANEMKERVASILSVERLESHISTYHSFCARFLREEISILGYPRNFTILDDEDQEKVIKKLLDECDNKYEIKAKDVVSYISDLKTYQMEPQKTGVFLTPKDELKAKLFFEYEKYLQEHFYLDFDDLLIKTVEILKNNEIIRKEWSYRFDYVLVDEFQDTNTLQYELLLLLKNENTNVFVVGDPDQSIYTWRGANTDIILNFPKDFKGTVDYVLERNYRSTQSILNCANKLIANNKKRVPKNLVANNTSTTNIYYYRATTLDDEANWVTYKIKDIMRHDSSISYKDFAVLYRSNYYSRAFENSLISKKIPYKIYGGLKFFARKEVKDAIAYLRLIVRDDDAVALERVINEPRRGIGEKTFKKLSDSAKSENKSILKYLKDKYRDMDDGTTLADFAKTIIDFEDRLKTEKGKINFGKFLHDLLLEVGYINMLTIDKEEDRLENVAELENFLFNYQTKDALIELDDIIQEVTLYSAQDDIQSVDSVTLMTIHTAKGLEFPYVFVVGLMEGVFPNSRSIMRSFYNGDDEEEQVADNDKLEEERRLAYVAYTRAMKQLFLSFNEGYSFTTNENGKVSRFIKEIINELTPYNIRQTPSKPIYTVKPNVPPVEHRPSVLGDTIEYHPGELVMHKSFGEGVVLEVSDTIVTIAFKNANVGIKAISKRFTGLSKKGS